MGQVDYKTEIGAPIARVFELHVDAARIPDWFPKAVAVKGAKRLDKPGAQYVIEFTNGTASEEVTQVEAPNLHARHFVDHRAKVEGIATIWLRPLDDSRTEFTASVEYFLPYGKLGRVLDNLPPVKWQVGKAIRTEFDSFKAFVERDQGAVPAS